MLSRRVAFPDSCQPCLHSPAAKPPGGAGWLHEIKHDGFRMLVRRDAAGVRLFTRNGHDWTWPVSFRVPCSPTIQKSIVPMVRLRSRLEFLVSKRSTKGSIKIADHKTSVSLENA